MKNIFLIFLFGTNSILHAQQLAAPVNLREIKPSVGEWITETPVKSIEERTYRLSKYQTTDGGNGIFLQYDQSEAMVTIPIEIASIQMKVEPNPNNGQFTVRISNNIPSPGQLFVYDVFGLIRYKTSFGNSLTFLIDLSRQPSGVYFISYFSGDKVINKRVIIQQD